MKLLILIRHGSYSTAGMENPLSLSGRKQISGLCLKLFNIISDSKLLILCSDALRAVQSAEIISRAFGAGVEVYDCFLEWYSTPGAFFRIKENAGSYDAILIVGHKEFLTKFLSEYFGKKELRDMEFPMAAAYVIDYQKKEKVEFIKG